MPRRNPSLKESMLDLLLEGHKAQAILHALASACDDAAEMAYEDYGEDAARAWNRLSEKVEGCARVAASINAPKPKE